MRHVDPAIMERHNFAFVQDSIAAVGHAVDIWQSGEQPGKNSNALISIGTAAPGSHVSKFCIFHHRKRYPDTRSGIHGKSRSSFVQV
jgi:hypothetical protein